MFYFLIYYTMHLCVLLLFVLEAKSLFLQNKTKFHINDKPIFGTIDISSSRENSRVKIVISSKKPIEVILYTSVGIPLHFKGTKISYTGNPTYYQINNIDSVENKISLDILIGYNLHLELYIFYIHCKNNLPNIIVHIYFQIEIFLFLKVL